MASFSPSTLTTTNSLSAIPLNPLLSNSSHLSGYKSTRTQTRPKISCNALNNDDHQTQKTSHNFQSKLDRRNMLIGLGGLYGASTTLSSGYPSLAAPTAPDATQCRPSALDDGQSLNCCPPKPSEFLDFIPSKNPNGLRIRPAAHLVDDKYLEKYSKALSLMKALPDSDPRSHMQQADVHCAYCNGGYHQVGLPNLELQVHTSWLFFPFHRAYLYFYEKILGKLIDDPTFAIPYWNWDHPDGMAMPSLYNNPNSPFYDAIRDPTHLPPAFMDLSYDGPDQVNNLSKDEQITLNLTIMYRQMVSSAKKKALFLGDPYRAGDPPNPGSGTLERQPHGTVHNWTGNPKSPMWENMGTFYSAARDPIFYCHHANVDRTWSIWRTLSPKNKDFKDKDFLNSFFYFYDENAKPVKIYVKDVLDTKKLGYDYQPMNLPWINSRPKPRRSKALKKVFATEKNAVAKTINNNVPTLTFPKPLGNVVRTYLKRPRKSRNLKEKEDEEEVLVIDLEVREDVYSKFDVFVNEEDERPTKGNCASREYAGSFVNVPHKLKHGGEGGDLLKTCLKLGITELIEDLEADDDEGIEVIFVPRTGCDSMVINNVRIEFLSDDE